MGILINSKAKKCFLNLRVEIIAHFANVGKTIQDTSTDANSRAIYHAIRICSNY